MFLISSIDHILEYFGKAKIISEDNLQAFETELR